MKRDYFDRKFSHKSFRSIMHLSYVSHLLPFISKKPEYPEKNLSEHQRKTSRSTREKPLGARIRTNNKLNPHMTLRVEPGLHWWEASALTTALSLLPEMKSNKEKAVHVTV